MDASCLQHCLTDADRRQFEEQGYLIVEDALPPDLIARLTAGVDRVHAERRAEGLGPHAHMNQTDILPRDELFLELIDWPRTFPKVWGILGWNIYLYHTHLGVTPPRPAGEVPGRKRLGWHQDSGRLNHDMETDPRPRLSLKVAYFLSDVSEPGRGNMHVLPGSHLKNRIELAEDGISDPPGALTVCVPPGAALFFDRRIWHSGGHNHSTVTRKWLVYGYSYRWVRPKDEMTVQDLLPRLDPIRRQLLGDGLNPDGYYSPKAGDVPLRVWLEQHRPEDAV